MKMKKYVFVLMAAAVLASCSESEVTPVGITTDEITLRSSVIDVNSSLSRAAYEGTDLTANPLEAMVLATLVNGNYSTLHCYGTMNFNGSTTGTSYNKPVLGGDYKYPNNTTNVYLVGLHPATGWSTFSGTAEEPAIADGKLSYTLTGKEDVMLTPQASTKLNDVNAPTPQYANLAFAHQLTLMKISLSGDAESATNIKVRRIELSKANKADLKTEATVALSATPAITFEAPSSAVVLPCYVKGTNDVYSFTAGNEYNITTAATEQAYVIAPPVMASNGSDTKEYTFKISYLDGDVEKSKDVDVDLRVDNNTLFDGSTVANAFNITLKFVGGQIVSNATVTDWNMGGTFEQEI